MQTFRKLPTIAPNAPAATSANSGGSVSVMRMAVPRRPARRAAATATRTSTAARDRRPGRTARRSDRAGSRAAAARATSAGQSAFGAGAARVVVDDALQRVDGVEGLQLEQTAFRVLAHPVHFRRLQNRRPHRARRLPIAALRQGRCGQRAQEPRSAGDVGRLLEPVARRRESRGGTSSERTRCPAGTATCPARSRRPFSSRAIARSGRSGAARIGLGEKHRAKPIRDVEPRIERRRDVEQRIQHGKGVGGKRRRRLRHDRLIRARQVEPLLGAAVVLDRPDPVDVGEQRVVGAGQPPEGGARAQIQRVLGRVAGRIRALARRLDLNRRSQQHHGESRGGDDQRGAEIGASRYLKSRREKTSDAIASSMAM